MFNRYLPQILLAMVINLESYSKAVETVQQWLLWKGLKG